MIFFPATLLLTDFLLTLCSGDLIPPPKQALDFTHFTPLVPVLRPSSCVVRVMTLSMHRSVAGVSQGPLERG